MAWIYLIFAGILEVVWAVMLKRTQGFTVLWPTVITAICMLTSFGLLSLALKEIPTGTAYAVWTGIGAAGTAAIGILFFQEPHNLARLFCLALIICGTLGLKFFHQ